MFFDKTRVAAILATEGMDALLASTLENVFYLTGFWDEGFIICPSSSSACALVVKDELDSPSLCASIGDCALALESCPREVSVTYFGTFFFDRDADAQLAELDREVAVRVVEHGRNPRSVEMLATLLDQRGLTAATVGYDERGISEAALAELRSRWPRLQLRPAGSVFRLVRAVKTEEEIHRLHAAVALTEDGIRVAMAVARPGVTEDELLREYTRTVAVGGGHPLISLIYAGARSALGTLPYGGNVLKRGDIIRFDVGCRLRGYCSDIARNFAIGEPSARLMQLHMATLAGQEAALQSLRPGARAREVFHVAVDAVRAAGIPGYSRHHVGHGIGLEMYDRPLIGPGDDSTIEEGMTLDIETPYYAIGTAGLQPEDTVVVTADGCRVLTTLPRELICVQ